MRYVYPRLPTADARRLIDRYQDITVAELSEFAAVDHPRAHPVATGGTTAPTGLLHRVRAEALDAVAHWTEFDAVPSRDVAAFDRTIGVTLHDAMLILAADAAHEETWNFVTLVLLPDVAMRRFPDRHPSRLLGGQRNAFRRSWWRREVLGELTTSGDPPLGEDELVGIFERSKMARSRGLARALAAEVLSYRGSDRSHFARQLMKLVRRQTGPRLLDVLPQSDLEALLRQMRDDLENVGPLG